MSIQSNECRERSKGTNKLFQTNPYLTTALGTVVRTEGNIVFLDGSLFYAESGGQEADTGFLGQCRVLEARHCGGRAVPSGLTKVPVSDIQVETEIAIILNDVSPFRPGEVVEQTIDWTRRYQLMRHHSACHFLYYAVQEVYASQSKPVAIRGCHTSTNATRLDFAEDLDSHRVPRVAQYANFLISQRLEIRMEPDPMVPDVSYWHYGDYLPPMPCGGTHVRSAAELGDLVVRREKKGKGLTRLIATFSSENMIGAGSI